MFDPNSKPKQWLVKLQAKKESSGIMPHAFESVGKCEGVNPHTSNGAFTLGVGVPKDF
jgi:hypothetical protein